MTVNTKVGQAREGQRNNELTLKANFSEARRGGRKCGGGSQARN